MKPQQWHGCYDDSWKGVITSEAFAHPAKFSRRLVEKILDYMAEQGWIEKGCWIGDPFGGVGTGGIIAAYRGYRWIGMELEPKFVALARGHHCSGYTKAQWRQMFGRFGRFPGLCPTCQRTAGEIHGSRTIPEKEQHYFVGNFDLHRRKWEQLSVPAPILIQGDSRQFDITVEAVLTSPPYSESNIAQAGNFQSHKCPDSAPARTVGAVVTSPPYSGSLDDGGPERAHPDGYARSNNWTGYGKTDGQIATLRSGDVDAVVTSQPFLGARSDTTSSAGGIAKAGYEGKDPHRPSHAKMGERTFTSGAGDHREAGNIEMLSPAGGVEAIVSSPPYETIAAGAGGLNHLPAKAGQQGGRAKGASQDTDTRYGSTPGQIADTVKGDVDAIVSSPPYADSVDSKSHGIDWSKSKPDYPGRVNHDDRNAKHAAAADNMIYGQTAGQIGRTNGQTYWEAMAEVYRACFRSLKAGGVMAIVVKDFVKDGKRMTLCDDTMRLLVWCGFVEVERIHAMLVHEEEHGDLFDGTTVKRTERKSFFRRLHESKLAPDDPRRIDFEEVLVVRKPI